MWSQKEFPTKSGMQEIDILCMADCRLVIETCRFVSRYCVASAFSIMYVTSIYYFRHASALIKTDCTGYLVNLNQS